MTFLITKHGALHYCWDYHHGRPPLVFVNSLGADLSMWDPQLDLAEHFSVLRLDTRGHGLSSIPHEAYGIADTGKDVLALLNYLGIEKAGFCGLSMGGMTGQWLACHAPQRFHCFVLCNTAAKIGTQESWNARIRTVEAQGISAILPHVLDVWFTAPYRKANPERMQQMIAMLERARSRGYALACAAIRDADFRAHIKQITSPTLIISGSEDSATTTEDASYLAAEIAGAQVLQLHAAHLSNIEAADEFSCGIRDFILSHQGGAHG